MRTILLIGAALVAFVVVVNVIWFVAPVLGDPGVYRPLFGIVLIFAGSAVWRHVRGNH